MMIIVTREPFSTTRSHQPKFMVGANALFFLIMITSLSISKPAFGCYKSIISFGDSLADTGNLLQLTGTPDKLPHFARPPYGETFFHQPTGRCSDGRLVIDFIAESLGLPLVQPYLGGGNDHRSFDKGVNFAVVGATALDNGFLEKRGIYNTYTNVSLETQIAWFKQFLAKLPGQEEKGIIRNFGIEENIKPSPSLRMTYSRSFLQNSLILMGEIGGNDYNYVIQQGLSQHVLRSLVPTVVNYIGLTIQELIKLGARTMLVPGNLPVGCLPIYLTQYYPSIEKDYDAIGCLNWLNMFSKYHNDLLQNELRNIQERYPHVNIIYADYYNAAMSFYLSPHNFGFSKKTILKACCGVGGPYNYNISTECGILPATSCDDPSLFASWDGIHCTEAAYKLIAQGILNGTYTIPQFKTVCPSMHPITSDVYQY